MKGLFEASLLLVAASSVVGSPVRLGSGPVVQADGPMANMDANVFRPLATRDTKSPSENVRRATQSKFNVMRRRLEMFTLPFPHGYTWPTEPLPRGSEDGEYEGLRDDHKAEEPADLELRRRAKRFEHFPMNLVRRQASEVTVTTTTTTQVTAQENGARTVTATATATETIGAVTGGEQGRNNGTEAVAAPAPAAGEASTTNQVEASSTAGSSTSAGSATPGAETPANGQASSTSAAGVGATSVPAENAASSTQAEATSAASASTSATGGAESTTSANPGASETQAPSITNGGASSTSSSATGTTQSAQAGGLSEFQNANGINVPIESLGDALPKPESNSMSGLPLTPDPNQPQPTTVGKDLPAPTLSPDRGTGGTLIQPDALPGQGQAPRPDNQTPSNQTAPDIQTPPDNQSPPDDQLAPADQAAPDNQATLEQSPTAGDAIPTQTQNAGESPAATQNEGTEQSTTEPSNTQNSATATPTNAASNNNGAAEDQNSESQGSQDNGGGQIEADGGKTVTQLRPNDIVDLLNSAPPKRLMTREELDSWLMVHDKIAARRRDEQRGGSGFQARRLRRRKSVF